jgi:ubiquitin C-terminal hydrolase
LHEELTGKLGDSPIRHIDTTNKNEILEKYDQWKRYYFDKTNHSIISDMFYAHTLDALRCQTCETTKYSFGFFSSLALEISEEVLKSSSRQY